MGGDSKGDLQFERADYGAAAPAPATCAGCSQRLWSVYYQVGGRPMCERCKTDLELEPARGSGAGRFLRALVFGLGAGAVGAGLWYAVRALTGYEVGLISIVVGLMVGVAVKTGSRGRGGWLYQSLAVALTYGAIVSTHVPMIARAMQQRFQESEASRATTAAASPAAGEAVPATTAPAPRPAAAPDGRPPSLARALLGLVLLAILVFALACAAPFLEGAQSILGLLIIGFGLWEAWKINRRRPLEITGPFRVGAAPEAPAAGG